MLPKGFKSSGIACGLKKSANKDLAVIYSEYDCNCSAVFTTNTVKAQCVLDNQNILNNNSKIRLIIANSGNANACVGEAAIQAINNIKKSGAELFNIKQNEILTASTGIIGVPLNSELIIQGLKILKNQLSQDFKDFSEAILTTDLKTKVFSKKLGKFSQITGITKGSGMIHPNMATMLAFIMTDAKISTDNLKQALKEANEISFNQISVDGDTSTNDMVILLSNGASNEEVNIEEFQAVLNEVCIDLAKKIVIDGEGANKIFEVSVNGAKSLEQAKKISRGIVSSSLVKSAIFGNDPNWGRILAAAGQYGDFNIKETSLKIFDVILLKNGQPVNFNKQELSLKIKENKEIFINLDLALNLENKHSSIAWGCDLSYDYVRINAEYTT